MKNKKNICILGNTGNDIRQAYSWFVKTVHDGFTRLEHNVIGFDYKSHSIDQIRNFLFNNNIDILFTHLTFHNFHDKFDMMGIFDELRRLKNIIVIHTLSDARHEDRYNDDISASFDLALVAQTENIKKFQNNWKVPVYYWPYSSLTYTKIGTYNSNLDFKKPVFPGNPGSHPDRTAFLKKLQKIMDIKIISPKSKEDMRSDTLNFCTSNPCVLGLCTGHEELEGFFEVRPWQYLGAGGCMIMRKFKGIDKVIPEDLYYPIYDYSEKSANQVKELWEKIKKTNTLPMREKAFNFVQKHHSSYVRMKQTLEVIEGKRKKLDVFL